MVYTSLDNLSYMNIVEGLATLPILFLQPYPT